MQNTFPLQLKSKKFITPTVLHMEFITPDNCSFTFIPGQFITFHFELEEKAYSRSYSIGSIPTQTKSIEIAVSPFQGGPGTRKLFSLEPGDLIQTSGPFGRLILRDEPVKRYILIATGTGVTPYRAMLPELLERSIKEGVEVIILLGVKSPEELLYAQDFLDFSEMHKAIKFYAFYSRSLPSILKEYERSGYVQTAFSELDLNANSDIVYLCGNPNMIDDAFNLLRLKGFETTQVRREKYISPKK
jgi:ferredoxin-NADP reductase